MNKSAWTRLMVIGAMMATAGPKFALGEESQEQSKLETRVIDIRSLLLEVPDYRAVFSDLRSDDLYGPPPAPKPDAFGQTPEQLLPPAPKAPPTQEERAESLMEILRSVIDPDWRIENDWLRFYAGQLIVSQTPEVLAEVERMVGLLKAARSATVGVEAWFVRVPQTAYDHSSLAPLLLKEEFSGAEFLKILDDGKEELVVARATVVGFDGQRVYASSGTQVNVVVGVNGMVAQSSAALEPEVRAVLHGVTLEAQPVIDADRRSLLLDLRASIAKVDLDAARTVPPGDALAAGASAPPYQVAHFAGSFTVPLETVFLAGTAPYDDDHDVLMYVYATVR